MNNNLPKIGERVEKASHFIPKVNTLLDIGCGDGVLMHFIHGRVKRVYGIDNSQKELQKANKLGFKTKLVNLDKEDIPFKANDFDCITCLDVIEHVYDPTKLLSEIHRVLKKNGKLIISTPNVRFSDHLFTLIFKGKFPKTSLDPELYDGGHIHFFTYKDMHLLLQEAGFKKIQESGIINKNERGWKGKLIESFVGAKLMREFRTPGILLIATK